MVSLGAGLRKLEQLARKFNPNHDADLRAHEAHVAAMQAAGATPNCADCWDDPLEFCPFCARGLAMMEERDQRKKTQDVDKVLTEGGLPKRCRSFTFNSFPDQHHPALVAMRNHTIAQEGRWLLLLGPYGTGKTGLLAAALRARAEAGEGRFRFVTGVDLFAWLRAGFGQRNNPTEDFSARLGKLKTTPLLVIDDLGAEKASEWTEEQLFAIINARYEEERQTWISTNLRMRELSDQLGARTAQRIGEMTTIVPVNGRNYREGA